MACEVGCDSSQCVPANATARRNDSSRRMHVSPSPSILPASPRYRRRVKLCLIASLHRHSRFMTAYARIIAPPSASRPLAGKVLQMTIFRRL